MILNRKTCGEITPLDRFPAKLSRATPAVVNTGSLRSPPQWVEEENGRFDSEEGYWS